MKWGAEKKAACSYITRGDRILLVWHKGANAWCLPGGKVEPNETLEQAQRRELFEETGLGTSKAQMIFVGPSCLETDRAVYVYSVASYGPIGGHVEPGCPLGWFTREEILAQRSRFLPFWETFFEILDTEQ